MKGLVNRNCSPLSKKHFLISQTPMRITLGGGGTDVLWYSRIRGGSWISAALNKYVFVCINYNDDPNFLKIFDGTKFVIAHTVKAVENPLIRLCLEKAGIKKGIQITVISEISSRSGLGGSGSFEVGLLNALYSFKNKAIIQNKLAEYAAFIEIERLKKPVGPQDQYIAALGGIKYFEIDKKGKVTFEPLKLSAHTVHSLEKNLLYFSTGINRDAEVVLGDQKKKLQSKSKNISVKMVNAMDEIKKIGQEVKKFLLDGDVDRFGESFHRHWLIKKTLSDKVTNPQINDWYNKGIENGALGGKIMGAGGGGWFVFYVNKNHEKFKQKMQKIGLIPQKVNFDWEGTKILYG